MSLIARLIRLCFPRLMPKTSTLPKDTAAIRAELSAALAHNSRTKLHSLLAQIARTLTPEALHAWSALTFAGTNPTPLAILRAIGIADEKPLAILCDYGIAIADSAPSPDDGKIAPAYALAHTRLAEWARHSLDKIECLPHPTDTDTKAAPPSDSAERPTHFDVLNAAAEWALDYWQMILQSPELHCNPDQYRYTAPVAEGILREADQLDDLPPSMLADLYHLPAWMHHHHGHPALAEPIYRRCLKRMKADAGKLSTEHVTAITYLATFLHTAGQFEEMQRLMQQALELLEQIDETEDPTLALTLRKLAALLKDTHQLDKAEPLIQRALEIAEASHGPTHPDMATNLSHLADLLKATNRLSEAEPLMRRALEIFLQSTEETEHEHPHLRAAVRNYAGLLEKMGRPPEEIGREIAALYGQYGVEFKGV